MAEFTVIRSFGSLGEAQVYQTLLQSNGIDCLIRNESLFSILPGEAVQMHLEVPTEQATLAEEILAAHFNKREFIQESQQSQKSEGQDIE